MNHCLNDEGFTQYEGYIQLDDEGKFITITNKIPIPVYKITNNNKELKQLKLQYEKMTQNMWYDFCKNNTEIDEKDYQSIKKGQNDEYENDLILDFHLNYLKDFSLRESQSSFDLSDVESFVYGPFTSRFWCLRKHILHLDKAQFNEESPFYGWDCLTIQI